MRIPTCLSPIGTVNQMLAAPMIYRHPEFSYSATANSSQPQKRGGIWSGLARLFGRPHMLQPAAAGAYSSSMPTTVPRTPSVLVMQMAGKGRGPSREDSEYRKARKVIMRTKQYPLISYVRAKMESMRIDLDSWAAFFRDRMADELADAVVWERDWMKTDSYELWKQIGVATHAVTLTTTGSVEHGARDHDTLEMTRTAALREVLSWRSDFGSEFEDLWLIHSLARRVYEFNLETLEERGEDTVDADYDTHPPGYLPE